MFTSRARKERPVRRISGGEKRKREGTEDFWAGFCFISVSEGAFSLRKKKVRIVKSRHQERIGPCGAVRQTAGGGSGGDGFL